MLTLPHEVLIVDVVYLVILLTLSFSRVEVMEDEEGNVILEKNGEPRRKTHNPRMELPYTYLAAWYMMHCPALMSAVQESNGVFVPFFQKLEHSKWQGGYMAATRKIIQSNINYHLFRCFSDFPRTAFGDTSIDVQGQMDSRHFLPVFSACC